MRQTLNHLGILSAVTLLITILIWLPYLGRPSSFYGLDFSQGFSTIYQNFDGLEYVIIAKTFYDPDKITHIPQTLSATYFPAHFPGYPLLITLFAPLLGFLKSMLFVSLLFTILSAFAFYFFVRDFKLTNHPLWLSFLFLILPARWVAVHSIGSAEPIFIFFTLVAVYFFKKFQLNHQQTFIWTAALSLSLAQLTRPPAVLIFLAFCLYLLYELLKQKGEKVMLTIFSYLPLLLVPLTLLGIFSWFYFVLGDFWAYFHTGDNIHLTFPPFQVFNKTQFWVGDIWLEDIVYIFLLGFLGGVTLLKQRLILPGTIVLVYILASISIAHRDIARYTLPVFPFILIAFEKVLVSKEFKIVIAIIGVGIYLYTQNFLLQNTAPIPNLEIFN